MTCSDRAWHLQRTCEKQKRLRKHPAPSPQMPKIQHTSDAIPHQHRERVPLEAFIRFAWAGSIGTSMPFLITCRERKGSTSVHGAL